MTPSLEEMVDLHDTDIAVIKNEQGNLKEIMKAHATSVEKSVEKIEKAIELKCTQDNARFKAIEKEIKEGTKRLHPFAVILITVLVGLLGVLSGIMAAMVIAA